MKSIAVRLPVGAHNPSWDLLGMTGSTLCIVHCISMPLVASYLPALGMQFLAEETTHQTLVLMMFVIAALAFIPGYGKHREPSILAWMTFGLGSLAFAAFGAEEILGEAWDIPLTLMGGASLVVAHWKNRTFCQSCRICRGEDDCQLS